MQTDLNLHWAHNVMSEGTPSDVTVHVYILYISGVELFTRTVESHVVKAHVIGLGEVILDLEVIPVKLKQKDALLQIALPGDLGNVQVVNTQ